MNSNPHVISFLQWRHGHVTRRVEWRWTTRVHFCKLFTAIFNYFRFNVFIPVSRFWHDVCKEYINAWFRSYKIASDVVISVAIVTLYGVEDNGVLFTKTAQVGGDPRWKPRSSATRTSLSSANQKERKESIDTYVVQDGSIIYIDIRTLLFKSCIWLGSRYT